MRFLTFLSLFVSLFFACSEPKPDPQIIEIERKDSLIMGIHDEVMPKIAKVLSLRKQIQYKIDSAKQNTHLEHLQSVSYALTKADADMMHWMRAYQIPMSSDTALSYLNKQEQEIKAISAAIYESIRVADSTLKTIQP
ncbi:MAG: hypothetical protein MH472_08185 [Bacteroidia bacterium]|nr:hypothetical protein [Bacteroidia bacterium]